MKTSIVVCFLIIMFQAKAQQFGGLQEPTPDLFRKLLKEKRGAVFIFLSPECPLCQQYGSDLNSYYDMCLSRNISYFLVFPNGKKSKVKEFNNNYRVLGKTVIDDRKKLTKHLNAKVTPQVVMVDSLGRIRYSGAIDNRAMDIGVLRKVITQDYLRDALNIDLSTNASLAGTTPIGCLIE